VLQLRDKDSLEETPSPLHAVKLSNLVCPPLFSRDLFLLVLLVLIDFELPISKGLTGYKYRPDLPRGPEGVARQATQREAMLVKKKKKVEKAQRRFNKEKEINRWVQGGESQSDVEVELESEEPTEMGDDTSALEDEGVRGAVVTSVEHCEPMTTSIGGGRDVETRGDVPESRKRPVSEDTALEQERKWARSSRPSEASSASCPTAPSVVEHADRSRGCYRSPASSGSARVCDPQRGDAPPVAPVVSP